MSILVTGASGFVGLNLVEVLLGHGHRVVALADRPLPVIATRIFKALPGELVTVAGDVRDAQLIAGTLREQGIERVAHGAAITSDAVRERSDPRSVLEVNLGGLACVAGAAADHGVSRFLLLGSVSAFGNDTPTGVMLDEDQPHAPKTIYALTKSASETALARIADLGGLDWVVGRLGTVYGPWEHDTGVRDTLSAIHQVTHAAYAGRPVHLPRPACKNWHYARDAANALAALLLTQAHAHNLYNLGSPFIWPLADWCAALSTRFPRFAYDVGTGATRAVELYGDTDGGLLSWDRFTAEFGPTGRFDLPLAVDDYLAFLDRSDRFGLPA